MQYRYLHCFQLTLVIVYYRYVEDCPRSIGYDVLFRVQSYSILVREVELRRPN